jgi:hypothetical protein
MMSSPCSSQKSTGSKPEILDGTPPDFILNPSYMASISMSSISVIVIKVPMFDTTLASSYTMLVWMFAQVKKAPANVVLLSNYDDTGARSLLWSLECCCLAAVNYSVVPAPSDPKCFLVYVADNKYY